MTKLRLLIVAAGFAAGMQASTFTGVITDTMCGAKHAMMKNRAEGDCVRMCTKGQSDYALFDGTAVLKLSDQKTPARYAGQKVKVTGSLDEKTHTIKVESIEAGDGQ